MAEPIRRTHHPPRRARRPPPAATSAQAVSPHAGKPSAADALRLARRRFLACERIDMQRLANELGVSRATLHRWVGRREQLLGNVLGTLVEETFEQVKRDARGHGAARVVDVFDRHFALIAKSPAVRHFLEEDAAAALRILTMRDGLVQGRIVRKHAELLREEAGRGAYTPRVDPDVLAYAIVRIGEAFLYNDAIIALEPNVDQARAIVRLLLD
jgi:AcrR family transcriptional regulator